VRRDRGSHAISARFTYDGGHFSDRYRSALSVDADLFDPVLLLRGVPSRALLDSAPWLALYAEMRSPR
jgi:hypothetical protein